MYILGGLEDQISLLAWGMVSDGIFSIDNSLSNFFIYQWAFRDFINPLGSNQPIIWLFLSIVLTLFGSGFYNVFLVLTTVANFLGSQLLFKKYKYGLFYSFIFSFSSFFWIHFGVHPDLMQIWTMPVFLHYFLNFTQAGNYTVNNILKLAAVLTVTILISNYLGFILLLFVFSYCFVKLCVDYIFKKLVDFGFYIGVLKSVLIAAAISLIFLLQFINATYFTSSVSSTKNVQRTYEDFFTFSSRPWYFFTPPVKNPILGKLSASFIQKLEKSNYFLTDDYFAREHSANYFGLSLLVIFFIAEILVLIKNKDNKEFLRNHFLDIGVIMLIISFTMPPFFTVSGITFYTPGWLIYKIFPVFRVTARFSIIVHLLLLLLLAKNVEYLNAFYIKTKRLIVTFIPMLAFLTIFETFVPIRVAKIDQPPEVYTYLSQLPSGTANFAVYPYNRTDDAFFWLPIHKQLLVNPRDYKVNFNSELFTDSLITYEGIAEYKKMGGGYIVVFKNSHMQNEFTNLGNVGLIFEFDDSYLYKTL